MIIILGLIAIWLAIIFTVYIVAVHDRTNDIAGTIIVGAVIMGFLFPAIIGKSYKNYLVHRATYDTIVSQFRQSIEMYEDYAVLDFSDQKGLTDFKYQGYQESITQLITDLRREIIVYNKIFIIKKKLDTNPFFSWFIIPPDEDMKLLQMKE